jgi:DNA-binding NtrC family response regulator
MPSPLVLLFGGGGFILRNPLRRQHAGDGGLELLPKAKALRPDVPVIMITAYGDAETKRKALENDAEALLTKPIDFGTLRSEIDMRVERA